MADLHELSFHQGEMLFMVSKTYPSLTLSVIEGVQNGIDAGATCVYVGIDQMEHRVAILDNGSGATTEKFQKALRSVGKGIKSKDAMGRFGRGLVAGVHLCQNMTFISRPKGAAVVNSWVFVGSALRRQHDKLEVPYAPLDEFPVLPEPFEYAHNEAKPHRKSPRINWRTMLLLDRVVADRTKTEIKLDELESLIRIKLGQGMRQKGTFIFVKVRDAEGKISTCRIDPLSYDGEPLDEAVYQSPQAGNVKFTLYRARLKGGKRTGHVSVKQTNDTSAISMAELRSQALGARWYSKDDALKEIKEGIDALCSGFFEGEIEADNLELAAERDRFELNDALTDLYALISDWWVKVGQALLHDDRERQSEKRYQQLGEQSLQRLMEKLQTPAFSRLAHELRGLLPSSAAAQEKGIPRKGDSQGKDGKPGGGAATGKRKVVAKPPNPSGSGGEGKQDTSPGFFSFAYEVIRGVHLWEYDHETGVLTFNVRHPLWERVGETNGRQTARSDRQIMLLQEWLAFKLIMLMANSVDPSEIELYRDPIDREVAYYIDLFILSR